MLFQAYDGLGRPVGGPVTANLLDGETRRVSDRVPAYALYIDPPLGRVGQTEAEARAGDGKVLVARRPMSRVGRAVERGETQGFIKIVAEAGTQRILDFGVGRQNICVTVFSARRRPWFGKCTVTWAVDPSGSLDEHSARIGGLKNALKELW